MIKRLGEPNVIFSFFGSPGSGKGALAQMCVRRLDFKALSTGNLFRKHIELKTEFGIQIENYIKAGELIPDDLVTNLVFDWLQDQSNTSCSLILDGYPRTKGQVACFLRSFKDFLPNYDFRLIYFIISEKEAANRLINRFVCTNKNCQAVFDSFSYSVKNGVCNFCGSDLIKRKDDDPKIVEERLGRYPKYRDELVSFYDEVGVVIEEIDVENKTIDDVFNYFKDNILQNKY